MFRPSAINKKSNVKVQQRNFFQVIPEYRRAIRLGFGKFETELSPGLRMDLPFYHNIYSIDVRDKVHTIPTMQVISADNVTFRVDASVQYKIIDAKKALLNVSDVENSLVERCKMEMRNKLSSMPVNDVLRFKTEISKAVLDAMASIKEDWGAEIATVQIKDVEFDESMKQAMSTVAEATRQADAKIINAKADIETAKQYAEAAKIYSENPMTVRLREFQLWNSVSKNPASTIYVVPSNLLDLVTTTKQNPKVADHETNKE